MAVNHEQLPVLQPEIHSAHRRQTAPAEAVICTGTTEPGTKILPLHDRGGRAVNRRTMQRRENVASCAKPCDGRLQFLRRNDQMGIELAELGLNAVLLIRSSSDTKQCVCGCHNRGASCHSTSYHHHHSPIREPAQQSAVRSTPAPRTRVGWLLQSGAVSAPAAALGSHEPRSACRRKSAASPAAAQDPETRHTQQYV